MLNNLRYRLKDQKENSFDGFRGGIERKQRREKDHKGFTLVELIVVIVILAVLAAILIPGLLKWIDKAREKKYEAEASNIYLAAETEAIKLYGQNGTYGDFDSATNPDALENVKKMSGIDNIVSIEKYHSGDTGETIYFRILYQSSDGKYIQAWKPIGGEWGITESQAMPSFWPSTP